MPADSPDRSAATGRRFFFTTDHGFVVGPFEFYSLGGWRWEKDRNFRRQRPRLPRFGLVNWHDAPPHGIKFRWMRFGGVCWMPRWWSRRRWLGGW